MKSFLSRLRNLLVRWIKNHSYTPNLEDVQSVLHWLAAEPEDIPSSGRSMDICKAIKLQVVDKISHKDMAAMLYGLIQYRKQDLRPRRLIMLMFELMSRLMA